MGISYISKATRNGDLREHLRRHFYEKPSLVFKITSRFHLDYRQTISIGRSKSDGCKAIGSHVRHGRPKSARPTSTPLALGFPPVHRTRLGNAATCAQGGDAAAAPLTRPLLSFDAVSMPPLPSLFPSRPRPAPFLSSAASCSWRRCGRHSARSLSTIFRRCLHAPSPSTLPSSPWRAPSLSSAST